MSTSIMSGSSTANEPDLTTNIRMAMRLYMYREILLWVCLNKTSEADTLLFLPLVGTAYDTNFVQDNDILDMLTTRCAKKCLLHRRFLIMNRHSGRGAYERAGRFGQGLRACRGTPHMAAVVAVMLEVQNEFLGEA